MKVYSNLMNFNTLSKIFQPINVLPKNASVKRQDVTSKSQRLMLDLGIIRQANPGCFHFLPLGLRAMEKLTRLVNNTMRKIGAQKIILSTLTNASLWKTTGRIESVGNELFVVQDRHSKKYVLSPTHEESVSDLLASVSPLSYKQFPLRLYQIGSKYRDEIKPRFGLMRGRQFIMKDLYTFDISVENAQKTYQEVCESYNSLFDRLGVEYVKVLGTSGNMGGSISHEYHFPAEIGEDNLLICQSCSFIANTELCGKEKCPQCNSSSNLVFTAGIEVGHTFLLGDKYSNALNAKYLSVDGKSYVLQMGSYGLGLSRILAAAIEVLSQENEMRWPLLLAPYTAVIIPPKEGSKEERSAGHFSSELYAKLNSISSLSNDVLIDDRLHMTIGKRLFDARRMGYPFVIVVGNSAMENPPKFEVHDIINNTKNNFSQEEVVSYIHQKLLP